MIQQTAPVIATAILKSLYAGALCYAALRILLVALHKVKPLIKYHLGNISAVIPFIVFIVSLTDLFSQSNTAAPIIPAVNQTNTTLIITSQAQTSGAVTGTAPEPVSYSFNGIVASINEVILEYSNIIMMMYLAGVLLFAVRLLLQYIQSRRLKTHLTLEPDSAWLKLLYSTKKKLGITKDIQLLFTERNISPCILGYAKAVILVPVSLANSISTEQAEAILLHELAHFKQYDYYINLLMQCINCLLFFNPFTQHSILLATEQRELACDETAAGYGRNIELAETLTMIASIQARQNVLSLSLKKGSLLYRVQKLLNIAPDKAKGNRTVPVALLTLLISVGLMLSVNNKIFSGEKDNTTEQLKNISTQMYDEGNVRYIIVDAILDSIIQLPAKADVLYMGSHYLNILTKNGAVPLSERTEKIYVQKLQRFLQKLGEDDERTLNFNVGKEEELTIADILDKHSTFRKTSVADRYSMGMTRTSLKQLFADMDADGFIKSPYDRFEMRYSKDRIEVNGEKLTGSVYEKYKGRFKELMGIDLTDSQVSGRLTRGDLLQYYAKAEKQNATLPSTYITSSSFFEAEGKVKKFEKKLIAEMHKDGLIDSNYKIMIICTPDVVGANNFIFKGHLDKKYKDIFRNNHPDLFDHKNGFSIIITENDKREYPDQTQLHKNKLLYNYDKTTFSKQAENLVNHDLAMKQHDEAMKEHEKAMEEHDKAMEEHDKLMEEHDKLMEQYDKEMEKHDKAVEKHDKAIKKAEVNQKKSGEHFNILKKQLAKDKLIDTNGYYQVVYNTEGIYVNARKLEGAAQQRYKALFADLGYKTGHGKMIERIPEGVALEWETNNTKVTIPAYSNNMPAIAELMFTEGNPYFILAYAINDGLLKERQSYDFYYRKGIIEWDGKPLAEPLQSKYSKLMKEFFKAHNQSLTSYGMRGDGVTKKKLNTPSSSLRRKRITDGKNEEGVFYSVAALNQMVADKVVDTTKPYTIRYNGRSISINGKRLDDDVSEKYERILINETHHKPGATKGSGTILIEKK